jgi:hypothetical protein
MTEAQIAHGRRIEERQRVNHQPNGYRPITEGEIRLERLDPVVAARITAVMHPDPEVARALAAKLAA